MKTKKLFEKIYGNPVKKFDHKSDNLQIFWLTKKGEKRSMLKAAFIDMCRTYLDSVGYPTLVSRTAKYKKAVKATKKIFTKLKKKSYCYITEEPAIVIVGHSDGIAKVFEIDDSVDIGVQSGDKDKAIRSPLSDLAISIFGDSTDIEPVSGDPVDKIFAADEGDGTICIDSDLFAGTHISVVITKLLAMSNETNITHSMSFNGVDIIVAPGSDADEVEKVWSDESEALLEKWGGCLIKEKRRA